MIKSKIGKGLQRKGNTQIGSSILIEKTGAMEITVRAGRYTDTLGGTFDLIADKVSVLTAGTDNFVALVHNPSTGETNVWHTTDPKAEPPASFKLLQMLIGWGWFVIPAGTTNIADVPFYCFTWIDNDVEPRYKKVKDSETLQVMDRIKFYGKGEESGQEYEIDEMEHFICDQPGVYFYCPNDRAVIRGKRCKLCGNMDTIKIRERKL